MTTIHKYLPGSIVADGALGEREIRIVATTGVIDRQGDIVDPLGVQLDNYKPNNVVLAGHDPSQPIGNAWPSIVNGRLEATVRFAPAGVSAKADEFCGLYKSGVMKAVSIGFQPIESEPLAGGGRRFTKWELLEISLVAVPANSEALVIARGYGGRGKSAGAIGDNGIDHLQGVAEALAGANRAGQKAVAAHAETREHLDRFGGLLLEGLTHARALARAGLAGLDHPFGSADETGEPEGVGGDDPDVELAARAARRKSKLDALDGAEVGRVAPRRPAEVRELGGAFLAFELRRGEQALIDRIYGAK